MCIERIKPHRVLFSPEFSTMGYYWGVIFFLQCRKFTSQGPLLSDRKKREKEKFEVKLPQLKCSLQKLNTPETWFVCRLKHLMELEQQFKLSRAKSLNCQIIFKSNCNGVILSRICFSALPSQIQSKDISQYGNLKNYKNQFPRKLYK